MTFYSAVRNFATMGTLGPVHTETFSCVFLLFTVLKGIENNQLITWNRA